jgi:sulfoxide reductase heme-binding subunit YedZ
LTGTGLIVVHVATLLLDPYAQLKVIDLLFPFLAAYRPLWLGLGTLALDLLIVVTVASLLRQNIGPKLFRTVHWATYVLWPMAVLHALGAGTNATELWFRGLAATCIAAVVAAVGWRLAPSFAERGWARRTRRTA